MVFPSHMYYLKSGRTFAIMLVAFMVFNFLPVYLFQNLLLSLLPIFFFVFREWIFSSSIHDRLPFETFSRGGRVKRWGTQKTYSIQPRQVLILFLTMAQSHIDILFRVLND